LFLFPARADGVVVQIRNSQLYSSQLGNFSSAARLVHSIQFLVDPWTTLEKMQRLQGLVNQFLAKDMPFLHHPCATDISDFNPTYGPGYLEMRVQARYRKGSPPKDYATWKQHRARLCLELQNYLRDLNMQMKAPGGWLDTHFDTNALTKPKIE
jgi:hypothetical protein